MIAEQGVSLMMLGMDVAVHPCVHSHRLYGAAAHKPQQRCVLAYAAPVVHTDSDMRAGSPSG